MQSDWTAWATLKAWVAEEAPEISMYNVAFVYEGYGYYGMLR